MLESVELGLSGVSLVMQPGWWLPWQDALPARQARAKPLAELMARRPEAADALRRAARDSGLPPEQLRYLPLTSHKTLDWVALLDAHAWVYLALEPAGGATAAAYPGIAIEQIVDQGVGRQP